MQLWLMNTQCFVSSHLLSQEKGSQCYLFFTQDDSKSVCLPVHVCACVYVCIPVCICMCTCMYVCTYACVYMHVYVCMQVYLYVCVYIYACVYMHLYVCMCTCACMNMYVFKGMFMFVQASIHMFVPVYGGQWLTLGAVLLICETVSYWTRIYWIGWMFSELAPEISLPLPTPNWYFKYVLPCLTFSMDSGDWTQILILAWTLLNEPSPQSFSFWCNSVM